jgi:hypothetical protein
MPAYHFRADGHRFSGLVNKGQPSKCLMRLILNRTPIFELCVVGVDLRTDSQKTCVSIVHAPINEDIFSSLQVAASSFLQEQNPWR